MAPKAQPRRKADILDPQRREEFANEVVDTAIAIEIKGVVGGMVGLPAIGRLLPSVVSWLPQKVKDVTLTMEERHEKIARLLYEGGTRLGGVPFKAMQYVSLRDDIPTPYRKWFALAQDDVGMVSEVSDTLNALRVLGLQTFEARPVKSASIAQVHWGVFNGKEAAIKVIHPHVRGVYNNDLDIMASIGQRVEKISDEKGTAAMLTAVAEKLRQMVDSETDFTVEATQQTYLRGILSALSIIVPEVYHSTPEVLIMQRLRGQTVADLLKGWKDGATNDMFGPEQRTQVYGAYAQMLFTHRFSHCDAHPGNLFACEDGRIGLLDFGQCVRVSDALRTKLVEFVRKSPSNSDEMESMTPESTVEWLGLLGVEVEKKDAREAATILLFGGAGPMFPASDRIDPELVVFLVVFQYLTRLETNVALARAAAGLADNMDKFTVLRIFKEHCRPSA